MSRWDPYALALLAVVVFGLTAYACWYDYQKAGSARCPCPQAER